MAQYRKKPVVIQAEQFFPDKLPYPEGIIVTVAGLYHPDVSPGTFLFAEISTLEGVMRVSPGDYVITGVKGERYPCKEDIFLATYDPVDQAVS